MLHEEVRVWDVIVVGAGLAGGMAARRLAERGLGVLVLEAGPETLPNAPPPSFLTRAMARLVGLHAPRDADRWPETLRLTASGGRRAPAVLGRGRGGSSAIYGGALGRFRRIDFDRGLSGGAATDPRIGAAPLPGGWPIGWDAFTPYYDEAERLLDVAGGRDPLDPDVAPPLRRPPPLSPQDAVIAADLRANGLHPFRLSVGFEYRPGCAECLGRRCPRGCKAEGDSRGIAQALRTGRAALRQGMAVRAVAEADGGVAVIARDSSGAECRFMAQACVLAAGTLNTPLILARSGTLWGRDGPPPLLGRGLMFHATDMFAVFDRTRSPAFGPRKTLGLRDFYESDGRILGEVQSMGVALNAGMIAGYFRTEAERMGLGWLGPLLEFGRIPAVIAARLFRHATVFATILEDLPYMANAVTEDVADDGSPTGRIAVAYTASDELVARAVELRRHVRRAFSPNRVLFLTRPATPNWGHPMGTCRMGKSPRFGVVDADGALWGLSAIRIADASVLPSSGGANPSLTIAANALRVADRLVETLAGNGALSASTRLADA